MVEEKPKTPFDSIVIASEDADKDVQETELPEIEMAEQEPVEEDSSPRQRRGKRLLSWTGWTSLALILLGLTYILAGYALVPYLFSSMLPHKLAVSTERPVTVGSAEFSPFTGNLILHNVIIGPRLTNPEDTVDPVLSFSRCRIDLEVSSLFRRGFICKELILEQFFLHLVRRPDSTYNITELLPPKLIEIIEKNSAEKGGLLTSFPYFSLNNISVSDSRILFDDLPAGKRHTVEEMSLALPTVGNFPYQVSEYIRPDFSARVNGSPIKIDGQTEVTADGMNTSLQLQMESVDLPAYLAYIPADSGVGLVGGSGDFSVELIYSTGKWAEERLQLKGSATVVDLRVQDRQELNRIHLPDLRVDGVVYPMANLYHLRELICKGAEINLERNAEGTVSLPGFITRLWNDSARAQVDEARMSIERLLVEDGRLVFVDRTVAGGYVDSWSDIKVTLNQFDSVDEGSKRQASFEFSSRHDSMGKKRSTSLHGQGLFSSSPPYMEGTFKAVDLPLVHYQPYIETIILGNSRIKKGRADISGRFLLDRDDGREKGFIIEDATAAVKDLVLTATDQEWFRAASLVCDKASVRSGDRVMDFGRVKVEGGSVAFRYSPEGRIMLPPGKFIGDNKKTSRQNRLDNQVEGAWRNSLKSLNMDRFVVNFFGPEVAPGGLAAGDVLPEPLSSFSLRLDDMFLRLADLPAQGKEQWRKSAAGSATVNGRGRIEWTGSMAGPSFGAELDCTLNNVEFAGMAPLLRKWWWPEVTGGILQAEGSIRLPVLSFSGTAEIDDFSATAGGQKLLSWKKAVVRDLQFAPWTALRIGRIDIDEPILSWIINEKGQTNLRKMFVTGSQSDIGRVEPALLEIGTISFTNGTTAIAEQSVTPPYRTKITGDGTIRSLLNRPGKHTGISVNGVLSNGAQLNLSGEFGLFDQEFFVDHRLQVAEFDIVHLSPYLESQLGTAIAGGKLSVAMNYRQEKGQVAADNHLEISGLQLGEKKQKHANTALTAALLLQPDGRMMIDVPVSGNVDDSNFSLRTSIIKKLRALQVKASVSPFLLVDDILKDTKLSAAERQQMAQLYFVAGKSDSSQPGRDKLAALAHLLRERPWLTLKIQGFADAKDDRAVMVAELKKNALYKQVVKDIRKSEEISEAYGREEIPPPEPLATLGRQQETFRKKTEKITVTDAELLELAHERSMMVREYLVDELGVERKRISVIEQQTIVKEAVGRPGNRVDFIVGSSLKGTERGE